MFTIKSKLVVAFAVTILGTAVATSVLLDVARAEEKAVDKADATAPPESWMISAYIAGDAKNKTLTNGFVVINTRTGKVSNCVANWMGQKDAKCYPWDWAKLP